MTVAPEAPAQAEAILRPVVRPEIAIKKPRVRRTVALQPEADPLLLLYLADAAHGERDGNACLAALDRLPANAWPPTLADHAVHRRATCEMLRGNCRAGRRLLEPLDGPDGARESLLSNCPAGALPAIEDRLSAVAAQADEARYAGNPPERRKGLKAILARQTASPELQACFRDRGASRTCGRRLTILARAHQVLAESFLAAGDCHEGATLDVMHSQVKMQSLTPEESDPALRCRAERVAAAYPSCAAAGEEAERRCVARVRAASPDDHLTPDLPR
jgi:hypothetical protein